MAELLLALGVLLISASSAAMQPPGVYWGTASSQPLAAETVVQLLKSNNFTKIRLSDSNPLVLRALSGSGLSVTVGVPNSMLRPLNSSLKAATSWVHDNLTRYISNLPIPYVAVGDEPFLQSYGDQYRPYVMGAAMNIQTALRKAKLESRVKVIVPISSDAFFSDSGLPSGGRFREDLNATMTDLVAFLAAHSSPFYTTISPFLNFLHNSKNTSLDFALFAPTAKPLRDGHKRYKNSFDAGLATLSAALSGLGSPAARLTVVAQTGWPTDGGRNATPASAESYILGLMEHLRNNPSSSPETYILSLLDEDRRGIASGGFERHYGIFTFDGQAKYRIDFGRGLKSLVSARQVEYMPARWCVVNDNVGDLSGAAAAASEACLSADCTALMGGGSCSGVGWPANVSYAFNSYYQQSGQRSDGCDFGGLGLITTVDPSGDLCRFPIGLGASRSSSVRVDSVMVAVAFIFWYLSLRS